MKILCTFSLCFIAAPLVAQVSTGELLLNVIDSTGLGLKATVLSDDVGAALSQLSGHFPDSQDQRNTVRTRFQYQFTPRIWLAMGLLSGSGLPFEFDGEQADALAQYGPAVVNRLNFDCGRVNPSLSIQASLGVDVYKSERINSRFQVDGDNLTNRLNVIDFGGLFSGNAIGRARSLSLRLNTSF
jgi:hypothetical protein